jgi:hypothetical protein
MKDAFCIRVSFIIVSSQSTFRPNRLRCFSALLSSRQRRLTCHARPLEWVVAVPEVVEVEVLFVRF